MFGRVRDGRGGGNIVCMDGGCRLADTVGTSYNFGTLSRTRIRVKSRGSIVCPPQWLGFWSEMRFIGLLHACGHFRLHPPETVLFLFHLPEHLLALSFPSFICDERCHSLDQIRLLDQ